jgi:hypothetical protein
MHASRSYFYASGALPLHVKAHSAALAESEALSASLQHRAFAGQL